MKKLISTIYIVLFLGLVTFMSSCQDIINVDTNRVMLSDDNVLNSPNDTVYSIIGILSKVQKLSDKYVLLGELRGDLMDVTVNSRSELRDLSNFSVDSTSSSFSDVKDYYAVINNCNYFIQKADTSITSNGIKPFVKEVAVAKSIRAWTYLQLVLNYGKATYFEKPLLTVNDTKEVFPVYNIQQMVDILISSLTPLVNIDYPNYGTINGAESKYLFINVPFLLGDLYLWKASLNGGNIADYEQAASYYAYLIAFKGYTIDAKIGIAAWNTQSFTGYTDSWTPLFYSMVGNTELVTAIKLSYANINGVTGSLYGYCYNSFEVTASKRLMDLFAGQIYAYPNTVTTPATPVFYSGDLRQSGTVFTLTSDYSSNKISYSAGNNVIMKFQNNNVNIYRAGLLYLRYAEAVNRIGKPGLAFAVLKYGLNAASLTDTKKVPTGDLKSERSYITMFNNSVFTGNVGIHNRGCGSSDINTSYIIPSNVKTTNDSINFVEDAIVDELALETGLEGNRFQDLMRISNYRNNPSYLADKIAQKHTDYTHFYNLLLNQKNWFIPEPK